MINPIDKTSTTDKVIESIRTYIQDPDRKPGEKLPSENELSKLLGVGRSSIREALRVLQTMGYVEIIHGRGAFVRSTTPTSEAAERWFKENMYTLNDIYAVREMIEPMIARLAAKNITQEDVEELQRNVMEMEAVANLPLEKANPNRMTLLDEEFHAMLSESTRNPFLIAMYRQFTPALHLYRQNSFCVLENRTNALAPHKAILAAVASHDADLAEKNMKEHIAISRRDTCAAVEHNGLM